MEYRARITKEGNKWLSSFPDCPGCQTFGRSKREAVSKGREALEGWLEAHLALGRVPPRPRARRGVLVSISPILSVVLQLRQARADRELSQAAVAKLAGITQQAIARLEHPDGNPTIATIEKVAAALGLHLDIELRAA